MLLRVFKIDFVCKILFWRWFCFLWSVGFCLCLKRLIFFRIFVVLLFIFLLFKYNLYVFNVEDCFVMRWIICWRIFGFILFGGIGFFIFFFIFWIGIVKFIFDFVGLNYFFLELLIIIFFLFFGLFIKWRKCLWNNLYLVF